MTTRPTCRGVDAAGRRRLQWKI